ncbi:hypothetical protein BJX99DRAFT_260712 [Aspergillus californicus]
MSFTVSEHFVDCQYVREYPRATNPQDAPLKLLVKKYTPGNNPDPQPGDVTLVGIPGAAIPKEVYEPLWNLSLRNPPPPLHLTNPLRTLRPRRLQRLWHRWNLARSRQPDVWPSKSAAESMVKKFYGSWDPRTFDRYVQHIYRPLPTALHPVACPTPLSQEVSTYLRPNPQRHKQLGLPHAEDNNDGDGPTPSHDPLRVPDMYGGLNRKQRFYRP